MCRKGFHSLNVQAVVDSTGRFQNIVARWPGSNHDAFIWANSRLCHSFEEGAYGEGWLLGDSAYPLRRYLLTPVRAPASEAERAYNRAQMHARSVVERTFGVWKQRFRSLDHSGGALQFPPRICCQIIMATAVLHNMCMQGPLPVEEIQQVVITILFFILFWSYAEVFLTL